MVAFTGGTGEPTHTWQAVGPWPLAKLQLLLLKELLPFCVPPGTSRPELPATMGLTSVSALLLASTCCWV